MNRNEYIANTYRAMENMEIIAERKTLVMQNLPQGRAQRNGCVLARSILHQKQTIPAISLPHHINRKVLNAKGKGQGKTST